MSMCSTSRQPRELCSNRISGSCCEILAVSSFEQHELLWYQLQFTARRSEGLRCAVCGMWHGCTRYASVRACVCCKWCRHREAGPEVLTVHKIDLRERAGGTADTTADPPEQQHEQMARCRRAPWQAHATRASSHAKCVRLPPARSRARESLRKSRPLAREGAAVRRTRRFMDTNMAKPRRAYEAAWRSSHPCVRQESRPRSSRASSSTIRRASGS